MKVEPNSRQIPKKEEYTTNKMYSDVVYAWLQVNSYKKEGEKIRWIPKKEVKFTDIAQALGISRQTASTKFKKLLDEKLGLVSYNQELDRYELTVLPKEVALLVENGTLSKMVATLNENTISAYVYLFNRYYSNDCKPFYFSLNQIKTAIGVSVNTKSNNYIIDSILQVLKKLELLDYVIEDKMEDGQVKSVMLMKYMTNRIPDDVHETRDSVKNLYLKC